MFLCHVNIFIFILAWNLEEKYIDLNVIILHYDSFVISLNYIAYMVLFNVMGDGFCFHKVVNISYAVKNPNPSQYITYGYDVFMLSKLKSMVIWHA